VGKKTVSVPILYSPASVFLASSDPSKVWFSFSADSRVFLAKEKNGKRMGSLLDFALRYALLLFPVRGTDSISA
jgi:hypothetical protein